MCWSGWESACVMSPNELAGRIVAVEGVAAAAGLRPGDELLAINDVAMRDVIDVQFYAAEPQIELLIRRDGEHWLYEIEREPGRPLGLSFEHPTFDTDVRRCNNHCLFCFVSQMIPRNAPGAPPTGFRQSLYLKDDDLRYSFLEGYYITLTNLTEEDWERIEEQRLSPLYVSVHATDLDLRRELLGNPRAPDVMTQLRRLAAHGIDVHTQLVIVPEMNDGGVLARSVADLADVWPAVRSVSVVPVGLTRFHGHGLRTNRPAEAEEVLARVHGWQEKFLRVLGERFVYATDEWYLLADQPVPPVNHTPELEALVENGVGLVGRFLEDWQKRKRRLSRPLPAAIAGRSATLVTGQLFGPILRAAAEELGALPGMRLGVEAIRNTTLGEMVTVSGLLMGRDVVQQLSEIELGSLVALPAVMFRGPRETTLDDMSQEEISTALGRPVVLAETMSDVVRALAGGTGGN
jgi:putative radical SAM enzyme (TIGR03279 family)